MPRTGEPRDLAALRKAVRETPGALVGWAPGGRAVLVLEMLGSSGEDRRMFGLALRWSGRGERVSGGVWLVDAGWLGAAAPVGP